MRRGPSELAAKRPVVSDMKNKIRAGQQRTNALMFYLSRGRAPSPPQTREGTTEMPRNITPPTADDVRAWGRSKGYEVADKGRLSHALIAAYNKGRKNTFVQTHAPVPQPITVVVGSTTDKRGRTRKVTETVTAGPIRAWAKAQGIDLGQRGRIPASVVTAYEDALVTAAEKAAKAEAAKAKRAATRAAKAAEKAAVKETVNA